MTDMLIIEVVGPTALPYVGLRLLLRGYGSTGATGYVARYELRKSNLTLPVQLSKLKLTLTTFAIKHRVFTIQCRYALG